MSDMTPEAIESDQSLGLPLFPVKKIYNDPDFNSRGYISPLDVIDLAKDIAKRGIIEPPVIRPRIATTPPEYDYVLIAGHRRHKSYEVNKHDLIPAILRENISEFQARTLNAVENLKRSDLNILQEAKTVAHYKLAGWGRDEVAAELGMSHGWVQVRYMLLDLPEEIQEAAASGYFNQQQIRDLYTIKGRDHKLEAAKRIKESKLRNDDKKVTIIVRKPGRNSKSIRKKPEMVQMMDEVVKACGDYNLTTRVLAWCVGNLSNLEIYTVLKDESRKQGIEYQIPEFEE